MYWLRSVVAISGGFAVTTVVIVALGETFGEFIVHGVELDLEYNPTRAGNIGLAINVGVMLIPVTALGGLVAALLSPGRRWWHGLGVGVALCAITVMLWVDALRRGDAAMLWVSPIIMIGIIAGGTLGGLIGQGIVALLTCGRARFIRSAEVPSD